MVESNSSQRTEMGLVLGCMADWFFEGVVLQYEAEIVGYPPMSVILLRTRWSSLVWNGHSRL